MLYFKSNLFKTTETLDLYTCLTDLIINCTFYVRQKISL